MHRIKRPYRKPDFIVVLIFAVVVSLSVTVAFQIRSEVKADATPVAEEGYRPGAGIIGG